MKAANRTQFARNMYICIHINLELQYNCLDGIHKIGNGGVARSNEAIQVSLTWKKREREGHACTLFNVTHSRLRESPQIAHRLKILGNIHKLCFALQSTRSSHARWFEQISHRSPTATTGHSYYSEFHIANMRSGQVYWNDLSISHLKNMWHMHRLFTKKWFERFKLSL